MEGRDRERQKVRLFYNTGTFIENPLNIEQPQQTKQNQNQIKKKPTHKK